MTASDYYFHEFSGALLGLQLTPPYLRRQIWERIIGLISLSENPVVEVTVLKKTTVTILSKKFQGQ